MMYLQTTKSSILFHLVNIMIFVVISNVYGFSMKMIPIESPHLQIIPKHFTTHERHQFLVNISMSRVFNLRNDLTPNSISSKLYFTNTRFVTQIGLGEGNAYYSPYLVLDTASDVIWVQCEGCKPCFKLSRGQNFRYKKSTSFRLVSINDPLCLPGSTNRRGSCGFAVEYGVGEQMASVKGVLGRESFHLVNPDTGNTDAYPGLVFGCTLESTNFDKVFEDDNNNVAGIFGMSAGPRSFISQLDALTKGKFSYCLTPFTNSPLAQSTLYFGDAAQISGDDTRQVQTISMHPGHHYHLYVNGISVDGKRLDIDPSIFELDQEEHNRGFFIDSGSPYTVLPKKVYDPLTTAMDNYFRDECNWQPGSPLRDMEHCYRNNNGCRMFPTVTFHFRNINRHTGDIDMVLGKNNMFEEMGDQAVCLAVFLVQDPDGNGPCVFGTYQQSNFKFLFDVRNSRLSFVPQNCLENSA